MNFNKDFYKSKTMWAAILIALASNALPSLKEVISEHPDYVMTFVTFIFGVLRIKTTEAISFKKQS